jgi:hypothetical protein
MGLRMGMSRRMGMMMRKRDGERDGVLNEKENETRRFILIPFLILILFCGEGGIRTLDTVSSIHTFQACSFDHSDTSPMVMLNELLHSLNLRYKRFCSHLGGANIG